MLCMPCMMTCCSTVRRHLNTLIQHPAVLLHKHRTTITHLKRMHSLDLIIHGSQRAVCQIHLTGCVLDLMHLVASPQVQRQVPAVCSVFIGVLRYQNRNCLPAPGSCRACVAHTSQHPPGGLEALAGGTRNALAVLQRGVRFTGPGCSILAQVSAHFA